MAYTPTFGNTTIDPALILKAWAKQTWDFGKKNSYFSKFMGSGYDNIIQIKEDLSRGKGTSIEVSLLMPLNGAGVIEDKPLEGNEEKMNYRSCTVYLSRIRNAVRLAGRFEEQKTQEKMRTDMRKVLSAWLARYFDLSIFAVLTGTNPPFYSAGVDLPYTIEPPTADRILISAAAVKRYILADKAELLDSLQADLATLGSGNILDTVPVTVNGGMWYKVQNSAPVVKIYYGGRSYQIDSELAALVDPQLSVDPTKVIIQVGEQDTATLSYQGSGTIALQNNYSTHFTATLEGKVITVSANSTAAAGTYLLDISLSSDGNYAATTTSLEVDIIKSVVIPPGPM